MDRLKIVDLCVEIDNKPILKNFNLEIKSGEIHVIMGPNGTGKSTLTKIIMGDSNYHITRGDIYFNDTLLNDLKTDERARLGLFLGVQLPMEIEGVTNADFLRTALSIREKENFKLYPFIKKMEQTVEKLEMKKEMIHRGINVGFSGGERKKNEVFQMYMLEPKIVLLDEIDSGLDVDSLRIVGTSIMEYFEKNKPAILLVTHYQRLLNYIKPHFVHIMKDGAILKSGDALLALEVEKEGYEKVEKSKKTSTCIVKDFINHE